jgi:hypothetical protein
MANPIAGNELDFQVFIKTLRNYPHDQTTLNTFWVLSKKLKACMLIRHTGPCLGQILLFQIEELPKFIRGENYKKLRQASIFCTLPKDQLLVFYQHFTNQGKETVAIHDSPVEEGSKYGPGSEISKAVGEIGVPEVS